MLLYYFCSDDEEEEEEDLTAGSVSLNLANGSYQPSRPGVTRGFLQRIISIEEDHLPHLLQHDCQGQTSLQACTEGEEESDNEEDIDLVMSEIYPPAASGHQQQSDEAERTPTSPRGQPVGKETGMNVSTWRSDILFVK